MSERKKLKMVEAIESGMAAEGARRVWCMDRGVPTEGVLAQMRAADPPVQYLVGTPKGRLTRLEKARLEALAGRARGRACK